MPGPLPKRREIRQRNNKAATRTTIVVASDTQLDKPAMPVSVSGEWHPMALQWWDDIWASPAHNEYLRADLGALYRLLIVVNHFWCTEDLAAAAEIRLLEREFGLTPMARRRLEWTVVKTVDAVAAVREKRKTGKAQQRNSTSDPRDILDE